MIEYIFYNYDDGPWLTISQGNQFVIHFPIITSHIFSRDFITKSVDFNDNYPHKVETLPGHN